MRRPIRALPLLDWVLISPSLLLVWIGADGWCVVEEVLERLAAFIDGGKQADVARGAEDLFAQLAGVKAPRGRQALGERVEREHVDFAGSGGTDRVAPFAEAVGSHDRALGQLAGLDLL